MDGDKQVTAAFNIQPPVAAFTASSTTGYAPYLAVDFTNQSLRAWSAWLNAAPYAYTWDFGDGTHDINEIHLKNPRHVYKAVGTYTVTLTVRNPNPRDGEDTTSTVITVLPCPNPPVRIAGATPQYFTTLQAAYNAAADGDTIQALALNLTENVNADQNISVTLNGGYECGYSTHVGNTMLQGMLTTSAGTLTVGNLELVTGNTDNIYTIAATADIGGSISPSGTVTVTKGANETFTIAPDPGYTIVNVFVDGVPAGPVATYTFTNITTNHRIEAVFTNTLVVAKTGTAAGTVTSTPAGINCGADCTEKYVAGTVVTLKAAPDAGAILTGWTGGGCTGNGDCVVTMNADTVITAIFDIALPVADFSCSPTNPGVIPFVPVNCTDKSLRAQTWLWDFGDGTTSTDQNPTHTYTTVGSYTVSLTVTNTTGPNTKTVANYITVQSCANLPVELVPQTFGAAPSYYATLQAAYDAAMDGDTIQTLAIDYVENLNANRNISVTLNGGYSCDYSTRLGVTTLNGQITTSAGILTVRDFVLATGTTDNSYTIASIAGANGNISPSGTVVAAGGTSETFTIMPYPSYFVLDVLIDGVSIGVTNTYTFSSIAADHRIEAVFATMYNIIPIPGQNGTISCGDPTVVSHTNRTCTITPGPGYHIQDVTVDGMSVGVMNAYTFTDVTADHTVAASFAIDTYTITATSGLGGNISPSGTVSVNYGSSQAFTMTPDSGYSLLDVLVDDISVGAVNTYTFTNVIASHTIKAVFSSTLTVTKTGTGSGTITSSPPGINCGTACTAEYMQGTIVTLTAVPDAGMIFDGWSGGGCSGTASTCTVTLSADTTVTATFTMSHAAIAASPTVYYHTAQKAYDAATDGATILVRDMTLSESLTASAAKTVSLVGGYNTDYTSGAGVTTLQGSITINAGTVTIKNVILQK